MKIEEAGLKIIQDSRGKDTLESFLKSGDGIGFFSVPSGKSAGVHEVFVLDPTVAVEKFENIIKPEIINKEFENQKEFDDFLRALDGTENKKNLGGNLILALSLGFARLKAKSEKKELFNYIHSITQLPDYPITKSPKPIFNVINGGAHAKNNLDFQEFQAIPTINDFRVSLGVGQEFYFKLGTALAKRFGKENVSLGDEAGFSAPFKNNENAIEEMAELIKRYNYPLKIGLDAAASQFYRDGYYFLEGKKYFADELKEFYIRLISNYEILSIEDPFYEEDFSSFTSLTAALVGLKKHQLAITDDLTTTNPERLQRAIKEKAGNAILIKPNQIGTLTETLEVIEMAYKNNWRCIVSHRSGETNDDFIADLSVAIGAWGLKAGPPNISKKERMAKYERIIEILSH